MFTQSVPVYATPEPDENKVIVREPTTDVDTIYENYKDNSFELMTQELEKDTFFGVKEAITNASATLKNFTWAGVKGLGQFNAEMVKFLFSMDVVTPIKQPIQQLTSSIAGNMLSIAGTIGIGFVTLVMGIKFIGEQRFRQALRVFLMTILIFTGLSVCKDATTSGSLFNQMFEADKQIEAAFVKVNPVLNGESVPENKDGNVNDRMKSAGELIASRVFYTNVYEPYLLMNYGTSNPETIRKKQVEYKDSEYDRINILLDNDVTNDDNVKLHKDVTDYEADELKNRNIMYFKNLDNTFYGVFYIVVNLIQTIVYFVLCFVRLVIAVLQIFLLPLLPILLLVGLFMTGINVFVNYFKAFGMTIFMKAMTGFACIFFATFLSLGFQLSNAVDNPWQKILTILIYLLTPLGLYVFRKFLGSLFTGRVSLADGLAFATHPFSTEKKLRTAAKEREKENKLRRKTAQEERKDALRKRQEEAQKQGKTELGLKQQPVKEREAKRSVLRRELNANAQHKAPNRVEKAQQNLQNLHEKGRQQELKEHQQLARQRQRKLYDKENLQTADALVAANQHLRNGTPLTDSTSDPRENPQRTQIRQNNRRIGQSRKGRVDGQRSTARRQGQKQALAKTEGTQTGIKQRQATNNRSVARSQHRTSGQKPIKPNIIPNTNSQLRGRSLINGAGGSPLRQKASVRQKMEAVQQVIHQQAPKSQPTEQRETPIIAPPITRMAKRNVPPIKEKKARSGTAVRRTIKTKTRHLSARNQTKGVRQPRARK